MKKIFFLTVLIMITTVGFSYEYRYENIRYFSNSEIVKMIPRIIKINPHIKNKDLIFSGEILNIPLDGTYVSVYIEKGDDISKILQKGIPETLISDAKFVYSTTKKSLKASKEIISTENIHPYKGRTSIPIEVRLSVVGILVIFTFLFVLFIFLRRQTKNRI